jgi:hypothetical protein
MQYLRHVKTGAVYHYAEVLMKTGNFVEATKDDFNACYGLENTAKPKPKAVRKPRKIGANEAKPAVSPEPEKDAVNDDDGKVELEQLLDNANSNS